MPFLEGGNTMEKSKIIALLDSATSKEELLLIKWKYINNYKHPYRNHLFNIYNEAYDKFDLAETLDKKEEILKSIFNAYKNDISVYRDILRRSEEYDVCPFSILELLNLALKNSELDSEQLLVLKDIKNEVEHKILLPSTNILEERHYNEAKIAVNMALSINAISNNDFKAKTDCNIYIYRDYVKILREQKHPLYFELIERKKKIAKEEEQKEKEEKSSLYKAKKELLSKQIENATSNDITNILKSVKSNEFKFFCQTYNFNVFLMRSILEHNPTSIVEFSNAKDKEAITEIYNKYKEEYLLLVNNTIREIKSSLSSKEPINLYEYYLNNDIPFNELSTLAREIKTTNREVISDYYNTNMHNVFAIFNQRNINLLKTTGIITCKQDTVHFTRKTLEAALEDINENNMPLYKGVIHGALKHQNNLKQEAQKQKKLV